MRVREKATVDDFPYSKVIRDELAALPPSATGAAVVLQPSRRRADLVAALTCNGPGPPSFVLNRCPSYVVCSRLDSTCPSHVNDVVLPPSLCQESKGILDSLQKVDTLGSIR